MNENDMFSPIKPYHSLNYLNNKKPMNEEWLKLNIMYCICEIGTAYNNLFAAPLRSNVRFWYMQKFKLYSVWWIPRKYV